MSKSHVEKNDNHVFKEFLLRMDKERTKRVASCYIACNTVLFGGSFLWFVLVVRFGGLF